MQRLQEAANPALANTLGPGPAVVRAEYTQLYLSETAQQKGWRIRQLLDPASRRSSACQAWTRVLRSAGLDSERASNDPVVRAAPRSATCRQQRPDRGRATAVPTSIGGATATGTTARHAHPYDQQVPLIFFGAAGEARPLSDALDARRSRADHRGHGRPAVAGRRRVVQSGAFAHAAIRPPMIM